jgi:hypothetical protein
MRRNSRVVAVFSLMIVAAACGDKSPTEPSASVTANLTAPVPASPSDGEQTSSLRPTLTVQNGSSDRNGARTYEFQISDRSDFAASQTSLVASFAATVNKIGVPEGVDGRTSYTPEQDLQPTTRFYWRARVVQGASTSGWSSTRSFNSKLVGFIRVGELYDPLIHGETVGDRIGSAEFIPGRGIRLNDSHSYVRYLLPQTITAGEFSMEVEGLRPNNPGNKTKVFGMQEGQDDFITNRYRVDIQYRGSGGVPPNALTWRAMFGSDDEKLEPDQATRFASVFDLNPAQTYFWKATWNTSGFRLEMFEGGMGGRSLYNFGVMDERVLYNPSSHYAYLGTPTGRSGDESASIPGAVYRNVWIGNRPRPASLGSALQSIR